MKTGNGGQHRFMSLRFTFRRVPNRRASKIGSARIEGDFNTNEFFLKWAMAGSEKAMAGSEKAMAGSEKAMAGSEKAMAGSKKATARREWAMARCEWATAGDRRQETEDRRQNVPVPS
jgi:hypothetical protein